MKKSKKRLEYQFSMTFTIKDHHGNTLRVRKPLTGFYTQFVKFLNKLDVPLDELTNTKTFSFKLFDNFTMLTSYYDTYVDLKRAYDNLMKEQDIYKGKVISYS